MLFLGDMTYKALISPLALTVNSLSSYPALENKATPSNLCLVSIRLAFTTVRESGCPLNPTISS